MFKEIKTVEDFRDCNPGYWYGDIPGETVEQHFDKSNQYDQSTEEFVKEQEESFPKPRTVRTKRGRQSASELTERIR